MPPFLRYATPMLAAAALILAGVATFNAVVDPFGMYRFAERAGRNAYKPATAHRVRLLKAYDVRRLRPDSILLSSSRGHAPFRTTHEAWAQHASRRYNLAFDGATTSEMLAYLRHAAASGDLKLVLLGLDFYHPGLETVVNKPDFDPSQLRAGTAWDPIRTLLADARLLVSADTTVESLRTLHAQDEQDPEVLSLAGDGQRRGDVRYRGRRTFVEGGPRAYFDASVHEIIGDGLAWKIPARPRRRSAPAARAPAASNPHTSLHYILEMVRFCRERQIDLRVFITPSHAYTMEVRAATGAWEWTENGKRALVAALGGMPVYDFDTFSSITTEPLPPEGSRQEMRYFWDTSHAKEEVGDMMLDRIFGYQSPHRRVPGDFGMRLTPDTVEAAIAANRAAAEDWRRHNPADVARVAGWVAEFKRKNQIRD